MTTDRPEDQLIVTAETLLPALGLQDLEGLLGSAAAKRDLFGRFLERYADRATRVKGDEHTSGKGAVLPYRIPGTRFMIDLRGLDKADVKAFVTFGLLLAASGHVTLKDISAASLVAALSRFRKLSTELGERSVYEVVRAGQPTGVATVARQLYGRRCPYPTAACRHLSPSDGTCAITLDAAKDVVRALVASQVLAPWNPGADEELYRVRL
ncbi:hypothetical protein [Actinoplanes sp. NPDC051411]|jgi:hypothetical protein|uniref:hypothetical protein n=1 Tax=Actinoplanes sp. NPDC051411 TaxID=3155522 RepID=UPI0034308369